MAVLLVLFALLVAPAGASAVWATSAAQSWLRNHAGSPDELAELRGANPEAFAIVQALLTKKSLGLLNSRDPTASMSGSAPAAQAPKFKKDKYGALVMDNEVVAPMVAVAAPHVDLPYANVEMKHHDWLNWKPHSSAADETMVSNVLSLVGGKGVPSAPVDAPADIVAPQPPSNAPADVAELSPKASSGGWGDIGNMWGMHKKMQHHAAPQAMSEDSIAFHPAEVSDAVAKTPSNNQDKDQKAVNNLLSMVASLKGGKAAEKLLSKHHIPSSETSALSGNLAAWGAAPAEVAPIAAPAAEAPTYVVAPTQKNAASWGSMFGGHKKPHHRAAPVETALASDSASPVRRAAPRLRRSNDEYTTGLKAKQNSDEKSVNSLLNMVASLKGGKAARELAEKHEQSSSQESQTQQSSLSNDMNIFGGEATEEAPVEPARIAPAAEDPPPEVKEESPDAVSAPRKKNLFLDSLTSSLGRGPEKAHHVTALVKENSYLKEFDLLGDSKRADTATFAMAKHAFASSDSNKILDSWFSDSSEEKAKKEEKPTVSKDSKLMSWLDPEPEEKPVQKAPVISEARVNKYLNDLS